MSEAELSKAIFPNLMVAVVAAVAAFYLWLTVRILNRRELWAKWTAVGLLAALIAYPISFGPACWVYEEIGQPDWLGDPLSFVFFPIFCAERYGPRWLGEAVRAYMHWWTQI